MWPWAFIWASHFPGQTRPHTGRAVWVTEFSWGEHRAFWRSPEEQAVSHGQGPPCFSFPACPETLHVAHSSPGCLLGQTGTTLIYSASSPIWRLNRRDAYLFIQKISYQGNIKYYQLSREVYDSNYHYPEYEDFLGKPNLFLWNRAGGLLKKKKKGSKEKLPLTPSFVTRHLRTFFFKLICIHCIYIVHKLKVCRCIKQALAIKYSQYWTSPLKW